MKEKSTMNDNAQAVKNALLQARTQHQQRDSGDSGLHLNGIQEAYAVQWAMGQALDWWQDGVPRYWKAGTPSTAGPVTCAPLPDAGVWASPADARACPMHARGIEAEIALRLKAPVTVQQARDLDVDAARQLVDAMCVAIELVDFRWQQGMQAPDWLKLADLQSHGALVLGDWVPYAPRDWSQQTCHTQVGLQPLVRMQGTHSLGDPTLLLPQWLRHATQQAGTLPAASLVTTGTWVGLLLGQPGDSVCVQFDGIGQASVQL